MTPAQRAMGREVAAMMREFYGDPENERRYQEWKTEREGAERLVRRACAWVARNPGTWERLRGMCRALMRSGHVIQRDNVYTLACQAGMDVSEASEFRRDHNLWSVLSRYMVMLDPPMLTAMAFRRSGVDGVDLVAAWEEQVGPARFATGSLAATREFYEGTRR